MSKGYGSVTVLLVVSLSSGTVAASGQTQSGAMAPPTSQSSKWESLTRRIGETIPDIQWVSPQSEKKPAPDAAPRQDQRKLVDDSFLSSIKRFFKDFRVGSCPPAPRGAPSSSWPARGQAAISICQS